MKTSLSKIFTKIALATLLTVSVNLATAQCTPTITFSMAKDTTQMPSIVWNAMPIYLPNVVTAIWSWGDGTSTQGLYPSHTYSATGVYNVCVQVWNTCTLSATACNNTNIFKMSGNENAMAVLNVINASSPTGISKNTAEALSVRLFPNPGSGEFEILANNLSTKDARIAVYDVVGKMVYNGSETTVNGAIAKKIDLSYLPKGTYFVKVSSGATTQNTKLVISK